LSWQEKRIELKVWRKLLLNKLRKKNIVGIAEEYKMKVKYIRNYLKRFSLFKNILLIWCWLNFLCVLYKLFEKEARPDLGII
jgi:hypothetical protein